jgi:hypothetical protein
MKKSTIEALRQDERKRKKIEMPSPTSPDPGAAYGSGKNS